jgi:hypothetical protein
MWLLSPKCPGSNTKVSNDILDKRKITRFCEGFQGTHRRQVTQHDENELNVGAPGGKVWDGIYCCLANIAFINRNKKAMLGISSASPYETISGCLGLVHFCVLTCYKSSCKIERTLRVCGGPCYSLLGSNQQSQMYNSKTEEYLFFYVKFYQLVRPAMELSKKKTCDHDKADSSKRRCLT